MGQQSSKAQSPLTFGYVNHSQNDDTEFTLEEYLGQDRSTPDFVLDNPHLYRLEFACGHSRSTTISEVNTGDELENMTQQTNSVCKLCKQNNRLSLVQRDLASDLNYIDETYYPDIIHYVSDEDDEDDELDQMNSAISYYGGDDDTDTLRDEEGWSRLTYGEVRPKRLVSSPSLAVDLSGKSLIKLSSSIGYLQNITKLDL
jgi:hypothetical protein